MIFVFAYRYEILEEKGVQTLVVKDLKMDDEDKYTCKIGGRESTGKLMVDEGMYRTLPK